MNQDKDQDQDQEWPRQVVPSSLRVVASEDLQREVEAELARSDPEDEDEERAVARFKEIMDKYSGPGRLAN